MGHDSLMQVRFILDNIFFILLTLTCILNIILIFKISSIKNSRINNFIMSILILSFIWVSGVVLQVYAKKIFGHNFLFLAGFRGFGLFLTPPVSLFFMIEFVRSETKLNRLAFLFVVPFVLYFQKLSNYQHSMYRNFAIEENIILGPAELWVTIYNIIVFIVLFRYFIFHLFNNLKVYLKQVRIIFAGFLIQVLVTLSVYLLNLPLYTSIVSISFLLLIFYYGIVRYDLLKIYPISLKIIENSISDLFIVLDKNLNIIEYNKSFETRFSYLGITARKSFVNKIDDVDFNHALSGCIQGKKNQKLKLEIKRSNFGKAFIYMIEIIPVKSEDSAIGLVVYFKDITELHEMQEKIILQERYAVLGMMMGGIAHNLKSPLMAISANVKILQDLVLEYKTSILNHEVIIEDHQEIAAEMEDWLGKTNLSLEYISNTLNSVKGKIYNSKNEEKFKIRDVLEHVNTIAKHELNNPKYIMNINSFIESDLEVNGSLNFLIQVIHNLIMNSQQSYGPDCGVIEFSIDKQEQYIVFMVKDFGSGIPKDIQDKLFKEMVTTKGKYGTGLGLYISYTIIKSQFKGDIRFESEPGTGTALYITIPL